MTLQDEHVKNAELKKDSLGNNYNRTEDGRRSTSTEKGYLTTGHSVLRPKYHKPDAQEEYKKENGHFAKSEDTAKRAYNPDDLDKEDMKKQHEAIYMSKHVDE